MRGLFQGNQASSFYFIFEVLRDHIRANKKIEGIIVGEVELKLAQFADDMNLFSYYHLHYKNQLIP